MKEYLLYFAPAAPSEGAADTDWETILGPHRGKLTCRLTDARHVLVKCDETVLQAIRAANPELKAEELLI